MTKPHNASSRTGRAALSALLLAALSGCTSTDPTLGLLPSMSVRDIGSTTSGSPPVQAAAPVRAAAAAETGAEVQFLPVVGAPPATVEALASALAEAAGGARVAILPSDAPAAPLRLKGYFSTLQEGSDTVVVYVWDVLDRADNRVKRIQGQERIAGAAADPWSVVGPAALGRIASSTMSELKA